MNNKEYIQIYKNYKSMIVNTSSEIVAYKESWSDEFCRKEINKCYEALMSEFKKVDFTKFTESELKELDFKYWDDDLILMPMWVIDCLKPGIDVYSINNMVINIKKNDKLSKDTRFGSTAYGFKKHQLRDSKLKRILNNN